MQRHVFLERLLRHSLAINQSWPLEQSPGRICCLVLQLREPKDQPSKCTRFQQVYHVRRSWNDRPRDHAYWIDDPSDPPRKPTALRKLRPQSRH